MKTFSLSAIYISIFFFLTHPATTEIYTLSLHDALPISEDAYPPEETRDELARLAGRYGLVAVVSGRDRKSTRLNSSHVRISYAVFCLKKKIVHKSSLPT